MHSDFRNSGKHASRKGHILRRIDAKYPSGRSNRTEVPQVDVGVIYTNERHFMPPLLHSLSRMAETTNLRVLLVDNASSEGVQPWREAVPNTVVLRNERRLTFSANLNRILRASSAPYVLLMHTDVYFDAKEPCLEKMVRFMESHPRCGISTCRVYHPDQSYAYPARRIQTLSSIAARRLGIGLFPKRSIDWYLYRERDRYSSFECDWVSGCFMFLRREAALDVGRFDVGFRKYFEDVDYCTRLTRHGWKVMFNGDTFILHHERRSTKRFLTAESWQHLNSFVRWNWKRFLWWLPEPFLPRPRYRQIPTTHWDRNNSTRLHSTDDSATVYSRYE